MKKILKNWDNFWFSERPLLNLAVFRFILCLTLLVMNFGRQWDLGLYYTEDGMIPRALSLEIIPEFYRPFFAWFFWPDSWVPAAHLFYLVGLGLLAVGIGGRFLNLVIWILHIAFLHRNFSVAFGADLIGGFFLLLMIGTQSCERLSLWKMLFRSKLSDSRPDILTNVFYRLIQLQLCIVYAYTGFEKLKGVTWWDGTALWSVLANPQMVIADLSFLRHVPLVVVFGTFSTIAFEIYFPALIWFEKTRRWLLSFGVLFHLGIGFIMALWGFALVMISPYVLFLDPVLVQHWLQRLQQRLGLLR